MSFEGPRDLKQEYLEGTKKELEGYRENRALMDSGEAPEGTLGLQAGQYLQNVAKEGVTYEQIGSTPDEIQELFGEEMREAFDKNESTGDLPPPPEETPHPAL